MKKLLPLLAAGLALSTNVFADDRLRDVQTELKTQGFYYGDINGQNTSETTAAIRRFQIRNGLEVTGSLNDETMKSLGIGVAPAARAPQAQVAPKPPVNLRRDRPVDESDKSFLRREEEKQRGAEPAPPIADEPPSAPAPRTLPGPAGGELPLLFAGTPYANAPREVQESTLRRAQSLLASRGIYRDPIDAVAGPATEEAILSFQRSVHLALTGRLDLETLSAMRLLPGRSPIQGREFPPEERPASRVFRGIWIR